MHADWPSGSDPVSDGDADAFDDPLAPLAPAADPSRRYGVPVLVGAGGMGRVERVHDAVLGREVARKTAVRPSPTLADRLRRAARLDHPGIVPTHDLGHDRSGAPWYTMRLVEGSTLTEARDVALDPRSRPRLGPRRRPGRARAAPRRLVRTPLLRKRLGDALARLRATLAEGAVRPDLVRNNGHGQCELLLEPGDEVEDQL